MPELRDAGETLSVNRRWCNLTNALVVSQVAASCVLLVAASMVLGQLATAANLEIGFSIDNIAFLETDARYGGRDTVATAAFYQTLRERIEALHSWPPSFRRDAP